MKEYGLLSELQVKVLYYKEKERSFREISAKIGTSHQNIAIAYRRAIRNIEKAEKILGFNPLYELINYKQRGA